MRKVDFSRFGFDLFPRCVFFTTGHVAVRTVHQYPCYDLFRGIYDEEILSRHTLLVLMEDFKLEIKEVTF